MLGVGFDCEIVVDRMCFPCSESSGRDIDWDNDIVANVLGYVQTHYIIVVESVRVIDPHDPTGPLIGTPCIRSYSTKLAHVPCLPYHDRKIEPTRYIRAGASHIVDMDNSLTDIPLPDGSISSDTVNFRHFIRHTPLIPGMHVVPLVCENSTDEISPDTQNFLSFVAQSTISDSFRSIESVDKSPIVLIPKPSISYATIRFRVMVAKSSREVLLSHETTSFRDYVDSKHHITAFSTRIDVY